MQPVAREGDKTFCPQHELVIIPHVGGPLTPAEKVCLQSDGKSVIRIGDYGNCQSPAPLDVVFEGAATFTCCGLPVARKGDKMVHGGMIIEGSSTLLVGGPTFSLPSKMSVKGSAEFQNKVIRDLYKLSTTSSGNDLLDRIDKSNRSVSIEPESDPHNSFCQASNDTDAMNGTGSDSTVKYNPDVAISVYDDHNNKLPEAPQIVLGHELCHALHNSEGTAQTESTSDPDPNAPASQLNIEKEEAYAIGTGSWNGVSPSENSIRADLGLGRRDNHYGDDGIVRTDHNFLWFHWTDEDKSHELKSPTQNLRPGDC
jgi:uncharacterized Zn-binding protein involved in type VI secretion